MSFTRETIENLLRDESAPLVLRAQDLRNINLSRLDLRNADLAEVVLAEAHLSYTKLDNANLSDSDLSGANFDQASLTQANLRNSDASRASFKHADFSQANLRGATMRSADLRRAIFEQATLNEADLTDVDLHEANLSDASLDSAQLARATMTNVDLQRASMVNAHLRKATLRGADLREANLNLAILDNADLRGVNFQGANLESADLRGADLREAILFQTNLRGASYNRATRWPDGFEPFGAGMIYTQTERSATVLTGIWPGNPYPLGATWEGQGVNFALFSEHANRVELCLFDTADAPRASARITMPEQTDDVWHVYLPNLKPGQIYAYRVYGPHNPAQGQRFNSHKLLIDPYAKALTGTIQWNDTMFGYTIGHEDQDLSFDDRDSGPFMPRCVVVDDTFPWGDDRPPLTPLHESIIYEVHVKGLTQLHPSVPESLRGTYAGLTTPTVIEYLQSLGVTAVELMPVHQHIDDRHLVERGLRNYWGYNTLSFFAPDIRYSVPGDLGDQVREFKSMVKALHAVGIEVILDVVYNHTAEGSDLGPTLSLRGIDNQIYYRLVAGNERYYQDYTGTGNTLDTMHPRTLQLVMDSLRYWVSEMHVDGFRFDLASALARGPQGVENFSGFLNIIHQDPVLSQVKLIAEPWDVGPGGYQVGNFPVLWSEWNGKYRDTVRRFWKGDMSQVAEMAYRLSGSSDLYQHNSRRPYASINFITAHDGFTLRDLVSHNDKHNEANGENSTDGESHNNSWNCGVEGETDDAKVNALRAQQQRNLMATLLLSQGVPMILAGDERGRSQRGNNNAYCQDNEISWIDWYLDDNGRDLLEFTRTLVQFRKDHPVLHRRKFLQGRRIHGTDIRDIVWLRPDGGEMNEEQWNNSLVRCLGMMLNGQAMTEWNARGQRVYDDVLLVLFNAHYEEVPFVLPQVIAEHHWDALVDTADPTATPAICQAGEPYMLQGRSLALLIQHTDQEHHEDETYIDT